MKSIFRTTIWIAVTGLMLAGSAQAFAGDHGRSRRAGHRTNVPSHVVAFAALEPVDDGGSGWGRFVARDAALPSGMKRTVQVKLFGLLPGTEYTIMADGVEIGSIVTDEDGDGVLKLQTDGEGHDEVPDELPGAADLEEASVYYPEDSMVLFGEFTVVREHVADRLVHFEKIRLEHPTGGDPRGMATVARKKAGAQAVATMGTGLVPGASYRIVVDTVEVGTVTADAQGQAYFERHVPADENPLPASMQPVDDIRIVDWFLGDVLVLTGTFSGNDDDDEHCAKIRGTVVEATGDLLVVEVGDRQVEIVITPDTEFDGFDDLSELEMGDVVKVEACWDGEQLVARSVELKEPHPECRAFPGTFAGIVDGGFTLRVGDSDMKIVVIDDTEFQKFDELSELKEGDKLVVFACRVDGDFVARWVKRVGR